MWISAIDRIVNGTENQPMDTGTQQAAQKRQIEARVRAFCAREALFAPPHADGAEARPLRVAAAVSGGADSMALLHILRALAGQWKIELSACHVNHGLRGEEAERDEAFVRAECARMEIPLRVFHAADFADLRGAIPDHAGEDWARALRYRCFAATLADGIDCVATAHTVTDQAETLLFRLARGSGLHGAAGIRPRRGAYVRPLLCLSRADTEAYCAAVGQAWVTDATNLTDDYARNRLRHYALPALCAANQAAEENLGRFCEKAARADAYFAQRAERLLQEAAQAAQNGRLPPRARHAGIVYALEVLQPAEELILEYAAHRLIGETRDAEERYVRLLCALVRQGRGAVQLCGDVRWCADGGMLWRETRLPVRAAAQDVQMPWLPRAFEPQNNATICLPGGFVVQSRVFEPPFCEKTHLVHKKDLKNQADYARITLLYPALVWRTRRPGDRFRPAGRGVSKSLRKWMNEAAIPPYLRDRLPLLAAGSDVVWLYGVGFADGLAPTEAGRLLLELAECPETQRSGEDVEP
jgi:tRNA(Ile)-lysidine synthase